MPVATVRTLLGKCLLLTKSFSMLAGVHREQEVSPTGISVCSRRDILVPIPLKIKTEGVSYFDVFGSRALLVSVFP